MWPLNIFTGSVNKEAIYRRVMFDSNASNYPLYPIAATKRSNKPETEVALQIRMGMDTTGAVSVSHDGAILGLLVTLLTLVGYRVVDGSAAMYKTSERINRRCARATNVRSNTPIVIYHSCYFAFTSDTTYEAKEQHQSSSFNISRPPGKTQNNLAKNRPCRHRKGK